MAKKATGKGKKGTTAKKKTTKASPKATGAKSAKSTKSTKSAKSTKKTVQESPRVDRNHIYVLIIFALLCVIALLVNRFYSDADKESGEKGKVATVDLQKGKATPDKNISKDSTKSPAEKSSVEKPKKQGLSQKDVNVYFVKFSGNGDKMSLMPIKRKVRTGSPVKDALNELIRGPSKGEEGRGLLTAIPDKMKVRNVRIEGSRAVLDFNGAIEENANGNILLMRVDQIVYTATQFKGIDSVIIKINGKRKKFLGGEGLSISGPVKRRR